MSLAILLFYIFFKIHAPLTETPFYREENEYPDLSKPFVDTLFSNSSKEYLSRMELKLSGKINGKGKLSYSHVPFHRKHTIELTGNVDELIRTEWYDNRCLIKFEPENSSVSGELSISFTTH